MEKEKGCSTAYLDPSPTVIAALTELGEGAETLVEVLKGCEELLCSQYSAIIRVHLQGVHRGDGFG